MSELVDCIDGLTAKDIIRSIAKTANGTPFYLQTLGLSGFSAQYQAVYDSFTTPPSESVALAQNTMVQSLVDSGVWTKLDIFYLFAQESNGASEALLNWISPGVYNATAVSSPLWTSLEGYTGDGIADFINSNWNPSTDATNYAQNSASIGCYIRNNVEETVVDFGCNAGGIFIYFYTRLGGDKSRINLNAGAQDTVSGQIDSRGFWVANRVLATEQDIYRNAIRTLNAAENSTGVPNADLYALCHNSGGPTSFTTKQMSCFFAGGGLTPTDITNFMNALETYMDSNGKGVIP
jgi:hypothetical protein